MLCPQLFMSSRGPTRPPGAFAAGSPLRKVDTLPGGARGQLLGKALLLRAQSSPSSTQSGRVCSWKMQPRTTLGSSSAWLQAWGSTRAQEQGRAWRARSAPRHIFSTSASRWPGFPSKLLGRHRDERRLHTGRWGCKNTNKSSLTRAQS